MRVLQAKKERKLRLTQGKQKLRVTCPRASCNSSFFRALLTEHTNDVTLFAIVKFSAVKKEIDEIHLGKSRNGKCSKMLLFASCSNYNV